MNKEQLPPKGPRSVGKTSARRTILDLKIPPDILHQAKNPAGASEISSRAVTIFCFCTLAPVVALVIWIIVQGGGI